MLGGVLGGACTGSSPEPDEVVEAPSFPTNAVTTSGDGDDCLASTCRRSLFDAADDKIRVLEAQSRSEADGLHLLYFLPPGFEEPNGSIEMRASDDRLYQGALSSTGASAHFVMPNAGVKVERMTTDQLECVPPAPDSTLFLLCEVRG